MAACRDDAEHRPIQELAKEKIFSWYRIFVTDPTLPYGRVVHDYLS